MQNPIYEQEILKCLPNETERLDRSKVQLQVYHGSYVDAENYYYDRECRVRRDLPLMAKVVDTLSANTYSSSPARLVPDQKVATEFLEKVYTKNRMTSLWAASDRYAHASDAFAFQVHATGDPENPIKVYGWTADQFAVWCDPDDQTQPVAVCTIDRFDQQTRYRLWTQDECRTYITRKWNGETAGARVPSLVSVEPNLYQILPFAFVHYRLPITTFDEGGIGETLARMQRHINFRLMESADWLRYAKPFGFLSGVDPTKSFPRDPRPGEFFKLPASEGDIESQVKPEVSWIGPPMDWCSKEWEDLQYYWNWFLESVGVPSASIPLDKAIISTVSGAALIQKNLPLYLYAQNRQEQFRYYETDLARVVLTVADRAYGGFAEALKDFSLTVNYDEPYPDVPPPDQNDYLDGLKDRGEMSEIQVIQKRFRMSREEALSHLEQVAKDAAELQKIRAKYTTTEAVTPPVQSPGPAQQDIQNTQEEKVTNV